MRLIDADELKKAIIHHLGIRSEKNLLESERSIYNLIDEQPTAEQPKKGHWEERKRQRTYTGTPYIKYRCSVCGKFVDQYENSAFCPFCGADMRGEQDEKGNH